MPGEHMVLNALSAAAVGLELGLTHTFSQPDVFAPAAISSVYRPMQNSRSTPHFAAYSLEQTVYAILISFIIGVILCPIMIPLLHKLKFGQNVRDDGPETHLEAPCHNQLQKQLLIRPQTQGAFFYDLDIIIQKTNHTITQRYQCLPCESIHGGYRFACAGRLCGIDRVRAENADIHCDCGIYLSLGIHYSHASGRLVPAAHATMAKNEATKSVTPLERPSRPSVRLTPLTVPSMALFCIS